ncbi:hypothetical protein [Spirosoma panaciterrae]|uniref:hypothetical protein n=1 Tax=Spirosoma panaciterrae TaxID=496058 RepID=UPI00036363B3|nr:hypothetical protein [Spirosoma panaciterrae]
MKPFAIALLLMLLVAKVVIGQTYSPAIAQTVHQEKSPFVHYGGKHVGYTSSYYSYTKTNDISLIKTNGNRRMNVATTLIRKAAYEHGLSNYKPIIKKRIRLFVRKLATLIRKHTRQACPSCVRAIPGKNHIVYWRYPESRIGFFRERIRRTFYI